MTKNSSTPDTRPGYLLHIGPVEIVTSHSDGFTTVQYPGTEPHRVASRYVIDFERLAHLERVAAQNKSLRGGFATTSKRSREADTERLNAELDRLTPEAGKAYGVYRLSNPPF